MKVFGYAIAFLGATLSILNITGLYPTVPFLGWLILVAGLMLAQKRPVK